MATRPDSCSFVQGQCNHGRDGQKERGPLHQGLLTRKGPTVSFALLSLSLLATAFIEKNSALAQFFVKTNIHPYLDPNVRPYFVLGPAGWPICPCTGRRTAGTIRKRPPRNWSPNTKCHFETHPSLPGFWVDGQGGGPRVMSI